MEICYFQTLTFLQLGKAWVFNTEILPSKRCHVLLFSFSSTSVTSSASSVFVPVAQGPHTSTANAIKESNKEEWKMSYTALHHIQETHSVHQERKILLREKEKKIW